MILWVASCTSRSLRNSEVFSVVWEPESRDSGSRFLREHLSAKLLASLSACICAEMNDNNRCKHTGDFMKPTLFFAVLVITLSAPSLFADDHNEPAKKPQPAKTSVLDKNRKTHVQSVRQDDKVLLTGSYIKRDIHRNGQITDGPGPLRIIDHKAIENSGASDLRQLLNKQGLGH